MSFKGNKKSHYYDPQEGYDLYAQSYDDKLDYLNSFEQGLLIKMCGDLNGKKVLDLACGTGRIVPKLLDKKAQVTGIDLSEKMLEIARKKSSKAVFIQGDMEKLPFVEESFDIVIAAFAIVHLKNLKKCFDEVYRVLKDDGIFVLTNINQKKAPKLKIGREEIVIASEYHLPKHVLKTLEENLFKVEEEKFIYEKGIWINQLIRARK